MRVLYRIMFLLVKLKIKKKNKKFLNEYMDFNVGIDLLSRQIISCLI